MSHEELKCLSEKGMAHQEKELLVREDMTHREYVVHMSSYGSSEKEQ
jgi:hypothetical protein